MEFFRHNGATAPRFPETPRRVDYTEIVTSIEREFFTIEMPKEPWWTNVKEGQLPSLHYEKKPQKF
jgi:hypothetical protein